MPTSSHGSPDISALSQDTWLLRGIVPSNVTEGGRISSGAFVSRPELSTHVLSLQSVQFLLSRDDAPFPYIAAVLVRDCLEIGDLDIELTPKEGEPGHVSISGTGKSSKGKKLRDKAKCVQTGGTPEEVYRRLCGECGVVP